MNVIDQKNNLALKHRVQYLGRYDAPVFDLSKEYPYFGYVDVNVGNLQPFCMFSNNDCSVAQRFFWCGSDAYERHSLLIWSALASKSSITIDIGAYTGIYSISAALANPKSKVFAFEALDRVYFRLLLNKQVNKLGNLQLFNKAVANEDKLVTLNVFSGESVLVTASSLFEKKLRRPIIDKKTITAISLDSQFQGVSGRISLVKIDAEGAEHLVLSGMEGIITRDYPDMLIEILSDAQLELITRFFDSRVYNYFQINDDLRELKQIKSLQVATDMSTLNTLITTKTIEELSLFVGLA